MRSRALCRPRPGLSFFREIGTTLGIAVVGAVFIHRLTEQLANRVTVDAAQAVGDTDSLTPAFVHSLVKET